MSSSTTATRKPPSGTPGRDTSSSKSTASPATTRTPGRSSTTANPAATNGVQRARSVRSGSPGTPVSARAAVRKPGPPSALSMSSSQVDSDEDAREEAAAFMAELKERLQKAEREADERQKQIEVLNSRLDDALQEQSKLEERAHEEEEKAEALENERKEILRQHRELEGIYEAERVQSMREKEEIAAREEEMQETIQRLKETMAMKSAGGVQSSDGEEGNLSRTSSFRNNPSRNSSTVNLETSASFAPPTSIQRSNSRNNSKLIHQKDKIIEGLRLELAEVQIKLVEMENAGGGRMAELEKHLLETRMTNARLMEDNESFQLLLSEKTLNGDLSRGDFLRTTSTDDRAPSRNGPLSSLADELDSFGGDDMESEPCRRHENEISSLKEEKKALTLYINKIIGRLLTHQGFESVLGNEDDATPGAPNTNKELPAPPKENDAPSFLQRAKSVAMGGNRPKPRPMSFVPSTSGPVSVPVTEDPTTAPSIPLQRSQSTRMSSGSYTHRRSNSEFNNQAASVITNMVRPGPTGPVSPGLASPRNSLFSFPAGATGPGSSNPVSRVPSGTVPTVPIQEEKDADGIDTPSPPRRAGTVAGGGVMTGRGVRPLRLVQNEEEASRARKAANRASWFAVPQQWFGKGEQQQQHEVPRE
ncbi:hypothetical protein P154DRAFT_518171 [Amniculicola lignicola CBS 123094]|uniref:M protein, serotype 2.1 n=1 Tax=Amniculicola lignicola CBS 123094 TaxID=1392246 RepID=A0A6A5X2N1_9PLEO|nr:hypothetical protein P154DRAFT_518171 [Amniculicola lignicola CBS 123094]